LIPYGRISVISDSIFSGGPVTSITIESGAASTMRAR
jgi:hypothetical protein